MATGACRHTLRPAQARFDAGRHPRGRGPDGFGHTFQRAARGRTPVVGRHILRAAAHVIFRVAQGDPEAQGRRRPLHQARVEVQGDQRRAIALLLRRTGGPPVGTLAGNSQVIQLPFDPAQRRVEVVGKKNPQGLQEESAGSAR